MAKLLLALALASASAQNSQVKATVRVKPGEGEMPDDEATILVEVSQGEDTRKATWRVDVKKFTITSGTGFHPPGCPPGSQLNWHIHEKPLVGKPRGALGGVACGPDFTGSHWDPTVACGPKSQWQKGPGSVCDLVGKASGYDCDKEKLVDSIEACEVGDLNGQMGKIQTNTKQPQYFYQNLADDIQKYTDYSIVFHCCNKALSDCGPRVACANFKSA